MSEGFTFASALCQHVCGRAGKGAGLAQRGLLFGKGRKHAASRYLIGGGHIGIFEAELEHMGIILCGAPSRIRRLIKEAQSYWL
jgi:hypothetical protein